MNNNNIFKNGLRSNYQEQIISVLKDNHHVSSAWLFGSRAIGTFKANSDIDIALEGELLNLSDLAEISMQIDLTTIPYRVDLLIKHNIKNDKLIEHINQYGVRWV